MDLATATEQLYAGSPDDFIERRKALVAEARAAKDRPLATAIQQLRRPTRSAWLVNLYAREAPDELAALLDLGTALQAAQEQLSGPELRRLSGERQKTLAAATRRAVELGSAYGYTATEAVRTEVTSTLQAALADPEIADQVRAGTVSEAHTYGGFGPFALAAAVPAAATAEQPSDQEPAGEPPEEAPVDEPTVDAPTDDEPTVDEPTDDERARMEAEQRLQEMEAELSQAAEAADEATTHADELADRVEELRSQLSEAEAEETAARKLARAARQRVTELDQAVRAARAAYDAL